MPDCPAEVETMTNDSSSAGLAVKISRRAASDMPECSLKNRILPG